MDKQVSYLKRLKFDPTLLTGFIASYLSNPRLVFLLTAMIVIVGVYSFSTLTKTLNPEIKIPIVTIATVLPGAGPKDVESLVTIPLEDSVSGISRVKTVQSTSRDSISIISIQFESGIDPDKARTDVQSAVDTVTTLPKDAQTPKVQKIDFENQPVWTFTLTGNGDTGSLIRLAQQLSDKLKDLSSIDRVQTSGLEEREILVLIKPEAINTYGINPLSLSQALTSATGAVPGGNVKTQNSIFPISIDPTVTSLETLRNMRINLNGAVLPLSQISTISERSKPDQTESFIADHNHSAKSAITFNVYKASTSTITGAVADSEKLVNEFLSPYNGEYWIKSVLNTADSINTQFNDLVRDFLITVSLVFIVLFIFLGIRQAIVASLSIPLTFLISFTIMKLTGISLSFIAFFSLLLALGLLVDDTVVVISAMTAYYRSGKFNPLQTGLLVWRDFFVAILTTTITTVWAFLPLLLSTGIIGEFIKPIPIVVSSSLIGSILVAMLVTLPIIIVLLTGKLPRRVTILIIVIGILALIGGFFFLIPKSSLLFLQALLFILWLCLTFIIRDTLIASFQSTYKRFQKKSRLLKNIRRYMDDGVIHFGRISSVYHRIITRILISPTARRRTIIMVIIFSIFSYLLLPFGFVKNEFFPKSDEDFMFITVEYPSGTNLNTLKKEALVFMEDLRKYNGVDFVTADLGSGYAGGFAESSSAANSVLFQMRLVDKKKRSTNSIDLAEKIRNRYKDYKKGNVSVVEATGGPPAGSDLQIKLFGDDLATLNTYADKIQDYLKKQPGVNNIDKTIKPGTSKLVFVPDQDKLASSNLTEQSVGLWLRTFGSGFSLQSVKFEGERNEKKDITFRMYSAAQSPDLLGSITIPTQTGPTPLLSLGSLRLEQNPTLISREDSKRTISVTAAVTQGYSVSTTNQKLEQFADTLNLPSGYSWKTGGVNEENQNSVNSILVAMILSFLLIIITMVVQFNSFRKALIVMLVIPLSISGVFIIFSLTHTPLSFPALIGVLALFGIVVKNSILIVDKISANEKAGMRFVDAITDAAESRLEPIALTSVCAIIGLIPVSISDPIWRGLGGAIISGLTFSGTIMLFFIPVVYYYWLRPNSTKFSRKTR